MVDPDGNPRCPSKVIVFNSNSFIKYAYLTKTVYIQTIRFYEKQELLILNQIKNEENGFLVYSIGFFNHGKVYLMP